MFKNINMEYKNDLLNIIAKYLELHTLNKLKYTNNLFMNEFKKRFMDDINTPSVYVIVAHEDDIVLLEKIIAHKSIKQNDSFYTLYDILTIETIIKELTDNNAYKCIKWMYNNTDISRDSFLFTDYINDSIKRCNLYKTNFFLNIQSTRKITIELIYNNLFLLLLFSGTLKFFYILFMYFIPLV